MTDSGFPLGKPVNRRPPPSPWRPIAGRPHWQRHSETGAERYVEPVRPAPGPFPLARYY
jgi:hypothetical protein